MDYSFLLKTQPRLTKLFANGLKKERLSQVYLLDGAKGTPKMQAAMYLANLILCDNHSICGECVNCHRIEENFHPRLFKLETTKTDTTSGSIKKEQIDNLEEEFSYSGLEKGPRVFIINDIEKATLGAANSLLKFLEEMKEDCYGIMLTSNLNAVLPTIKSRSQIITLDKINNDILKQAYISKGIDEEKANILCVLTNNISEGLELLEDNNVNKIIDLVKRITKSFYTKQSTILILNDDGKFLLGLADKTYQQIFLDLLITITNDRLFYLLKEEKRMVFDNTINEMIEDGIEIEKINYNQTFKQIELMLEYKKRLAFNVNIELLYIDLFNKCLM